MPVSVRYIVNDVEAAVAFYTKALNFRVDMHPGPGFARLVRGELLFLINRPGGGRAAGQSMPDGQHVWSARLSFSLKMNRRTQEIRRSGWNLPQMFPVKVVA